MIKILEMLVNETVKGWPFMGSIWGESEKGRWVLLIGSITEVMVSERVSRRRSPVNGDDKVITAEEDMVELEKLK